MQTKMYLAKIQRIPVALEKLDPGLTFPAMLYLITASRKTFVLAGSGLKSGSIQETIML